MRNERANYKNVEIVLSRKHEMNYQNSKCLLNNSNYLGA